MFLKKNHHSRYVAIPLLCFVRCLTKNEKDVAFCRQVRCHMMNYIDHRRLGLQITDDLDWRSTCADEQRPPSDSVKTLEGDAYEYYEYGFTSPGGSPCQHVKPCFQRH